MSSAGGAPAQEQLLQCGELGFDVPRALAVAVADSRRERAVVIAAARCVAVIAVASPAAARALCGASNAGADAVAGVGASGNKQQPPCAALGLVHAMAIHPESRILQACACGALGALVGSVSEALAAEPEIAARILNTLLKANAPSATLQALSRAHDSAQPAHLESLTYNVCHIVGAACRLEAVAARSVAGRFALSGSGASSAVRRAFDRAGAVPVLVERLRDASLPPPPTVVVAALRALATLADGYPSAARSVVRAAGLSGAATDALALALVLPSASEALAIEAAACDVIARTLAAISRGKGASGEEGDDARGAAATARLSSRARLRCAAAVAKTMTRTPSDAAAKSEALRAAARSVHAAAHAALAALVVADDRDASGTDAPTSSDTVRTVLFATDVASFACRFVGECAVRVRTARATAAKRADGAREVRRLQLACCALLSALWASGNHAASRAVVDALAGVLRSGDAAVRAAGCRSVYVLATGSPLAAALFAEERPFVALLTKTLIDVATVDNDAVTIATRLDALRALGAVVAAFAAAARERSGERSVGQRTNSRRGSSKERTSTAPDAPPSASVVLPPAWLKAGLSRAFVQATSARMLEELDPASRRARDQRRVLGCGCRFLSALAALASRYAARLVEEGAVVAVVTAMNGSGGAHALDSAILVDGTEALCALLGGGSCGSDGDGGTGSAAAEAPPRLVQFVQMSLSAVASAMAADPARRLLQRRACAAVCAMCERGGGGAARAALLAMAQSRAALKLCEGIITAARNFSSSRSTAQDACKALCAIVRVAVDSSPPHPSAWASDTRAAMAAPLPTPTPIAAMAIEAGAVAALVDVLARCGARKEWRQVAHYAIRALGAVARSGGSEELMLSGAVEAVVQAVDDVCASAGVEEAGGARAGSASTKSMRGREKVKGKGKSAAARSEKSRRADLNVSVSLRASACEVIFCVARTSRASAQRVELLGAVHAVADAMLCDVAGPLLSDSSGEVNGVSSGSSSGGARSWRLHGWGCKTLAVFAEASTLAHQGGGSPRAGGVVRAPRAAAAIVRTIRLCCENYSRRLAHDACHAALAFAAHPSPALAQQLSDAGATVAAGDLVRVLDSLGIHPSMVKRGEEEEKGGDANNARAARALLSALKKRRLAGKK